MNARLPTLSALAILTVAGCAQPPAPAAGAPPGAPAAFSETAPAEPGRTAPGTAAAVFAGGCFWCMEKPFDDLPGVISTTSGYTGGDVAAPTYELVSSGVTGHFEAVRVVYDPTRVTYARLLETYWREIDPHDADGQFCDQGSPYRPAIFVNGPDERATAEADKARVQATLSAPVVVPVLDAATFWPAEAYHQDYYERNPVRYRFYRTGCGRDARLAQVWGRR